MPRLSGTEVRLAAAITAGRTNAEIAGAFGLTDTSIESALTDLYRKLGVSSRTELAVLMGALGEALLNTSGGEA